jgi:hypothetical protein
MNVQVQDILPAGYGNRDGSSAFARDTLAFRSIPVPAVSRKKTDQERRENMAFATSPIASTSSPQSEKQTIRHGQASNPSYRQGKAPIKNRLFNAFSTSPPMFSAWINPSENA